MNAMDQLPVAVQMKPNTRKSVAVEAGLVALRAMLPDDVSRLWIWLHEFPHKNFDDYAPLNLNEFKATIAARIQAGEVIAIATHNETPVGAMSFKPITDRLGTLHGICFTKDVHGTGIAPFAVGKFIAAIMANPKMEKISASYFRDNDRIKTFLKKQGFQHEGTLRKHTVRGGKPIDMSVVALHREPIPEVN